MTSFALVLASLLGIAAVQLPLADRFVGTVAGFKAEAAEILIKPDGRDVQPVRVGTGTMVQRIAPGEKDLRKAETIKATSIAVGDRVFVTLMPGEPEARRIVVMPAADIAKRNDADRQDWTTRGVSGIVAARQGNAITVQARSFFAETTSVVTVEPKTVFKRYAPDSVRFADAKTSSLAELNPGDQIRARGTKSADGSKLAAEEVVFGTFVTHAGTITAVNAETSEVTLTDLVANKPLVVKITADSQLKKMPDFPAMMAGGQPGGPPDFSQMLERMPAAKLEDLAPGTQIVVSSTKGAGAGQVTAITLLANAGMLIRIASMQAGGGPSRPDGMSGMPGMSPGGMAGALGGLDLPGMIP